MYLRGRALEQESLHMTRPEKGSKIKAEIYNIRVTYSLPTLIMLFYGSHNLYLSSIACPRV
jgi:hypothetical protein